MVGVPGLALPDSALATARLPSVPDMVNASIANSHLARRVARPPSPEAASRAEAGAGTLRPVGLTDLLLLIAPRESSPMQVLLWDSRSAKQAAHQTTAGTSGNIRFSFSWGSCFCCAGALVIHRSKQYTIDATGI